MQITIGNVLKVSVRHTYIRKGQFYYQRSVPQDVRDRYPSKLIKLNLETSDPAIAARKVVALDRQYEAEWSLLRSDPESSAKATRLHAEKLLADHGIDPKNPDEYAIDAFIATLEPKRIAFANGDEDMHRDADIRNYLSPVEVAAVELMNGTAEDLLSDALEFYLETHPKRNSETLRKTSRVAIESVISVIGDKPVSKLSRADGRAYVEDQLDKVSTGTIRRRLKAVVAILNAYITEKELNQKNPFSALKIPGEGEDAKSRKPFSVAELDTVQSACMETDDDLRWIVALLSDTGARLAEIVGLALDDLKIEGEAVPHVVIKTHAWRRLKTKDSSRVIPLVGASLWAAKRVIETAKDGQRYAFPRYIKEGKTDATVASATLAKWIRSNNMNHTPHELRHTLRDRLREVQCPVAIIDAIGGWAKQSEGEGYGDGYSLRVKQEWLTKIVRTSNPPQDA